jgi:hypothetical protein
MVKHHVLIGLGFKKQNFRNRGLKHMLNRASKVFMGSAIPSNQMTIMPVSRSPPSFSGTGRRPLKFNY